MYNGLGMWLRKRETRKTYGTLVVKTVLKRSLRKWWS
jgi:hypothetical protein